MNCFRCWTWRWQCSRSAGGPATSWPFRTRRSSRFNFRILIYLVIYDSGRLVYLVIYDPPYNGKLRILVCFVTYDPPRSAGGGATSWLFRTRRCSFETDIFMSVASQLQAATRVSKGLQLFHLTHVPATSRGWSCRVVYQERGGGATSWPFRTRRSSRFNLRILVLLVIYDCTYRHGFLHVLVNFVMHDSG